MLDGTPKYTKTFVQLSLDNIGNVIFWTLIVYVSLYKLWLSSVLPFTVPMINVHDATWFFTKALSISLGNWMGEYNHYTLIKGSIYPLFLSSMSSLGISPKIAIDIIYIGASLIYLQALRTVLRSRFAVALAFILVLCNPVTLSDTWTYPLRMNLYVSLVLIYFSSLIALIANAYQKPAESSPGWILLCAASLALAWNTREESIWLLSGLFPMLLVTLWRLQQRQHRMPIILFWMFIVAVPYLVWYQIAAINQEKYGFKGTVDFTAAQFTRAASAIYSLNTGDRPYAYMTAETTRKLKTISPHTQQLIDKLVDDEGRYTASRTFVYGSHASWRIRSAMAKNGYYESFAESERVYKIIADDIEDYCNRDAGNCLKTYIPGMLIRPAHFISTPRHAVRGFSDLVRFVPFSPSDNMARRKRGDLTFQYLVDRYFKFHSGLNSELEERSQVYKTERKRKKKLRMIYRFYQNNFKYFVLIALISGVAVTVRRRLWQSKMIGLCLAGGFAASFSIYLLISTFAVPNLTRLLASSSVPLLCFTTYFLALGVQNILSGSATLLHSISNSFSKK